MTDQSVLAKYGFPTVRAFKAAYAGPLGDLPVDDQWGPGAQAAAAQLPMLSAHFNVDADHLRSSGNHECLVRRELLHALEGLRAKIRRPLVIVDAYRDPVHNAQLEGSSSGGVQHGAAKNSQHINGLAADIAESCHLTVAEVESVRLFSGIGYSKSTGHVLHVDVRHVDPKTNSTRSTPAKPAMWLYA